MSDVEPAIPAATLVLFREGEGGADAHLFVERAATMAFAAGAIVFPGGRVDAGDRMLAERIEGYDADDCAARVAAIRETIEEGGVAVAITPMPDQRQVERLRQGLAEGRVFADLLASERLELELDALVPFARWLPRHPGMRIFDTRFYIARATADMAVARVDATENVRLFWATAQAVLDQADAGEVQIIFPTRRNLERLAMLGSFGRAVEQTIALDSPPVIVTPWSEERDGVPHLLIRDDAGYPVTQEVLSDVRRY